MRYYAKLVGKNNFIANSQKFVKNTETEVTYSMYLSLSQDSYFETRLEYEKSDMLKPLILEKRCYYTSETMYIAIAASPNWMQYTRELIYSIFKHNQGPIKIFVLTDKLGLDFDMREICCLFGSEYSVDILNAEPYFNKYIVTNKNVDNRFTKYTLYRLLLPMLIDVPKLLYIDSDALCVDDLRDLFEIDMHDTLMMGVRDSGYGPFMKYINWDEKDPYVNAGVTLLNFRKIKELNLIEQWLKMINEKFYHTHDQDVFNITMKGHVKYIHHKYNTSISTINTVDENTRIIHYAGPKPWKQNSKSAHALHWKDNDLEYSLKYLPRIPKIIHYCWLGGNKKPQLVQDCISSWQRHNPDYRLVEWNETNLDLNCCGYVQAAYMHKKYAFVTDYVRLWALNKFGGIYMDCDVECVKPLDVFLRHKAFTGHETKELLVTATMGAQPEHPWIQHLLSYYTNARFTGLPNTKTITEMSQPFIVETNENGFKYLQEGVVIYPVETFCSYDHQNFKILPTKSAFTYHLFAGTWLNRETHWTGLNQDKSEYKEELKDV